MVYSTDHYLVSEGKGKTTDVKCNRRIHGGDRGTTYCAHYELVETPKLPAITFLSDTCQQSKMKGLSKT